MASIGSHLILDDKQAAACQKARACFEALPNLREIQTWTIRDPDANFSPRSLRPGDTEFWMRRDDDEKHEEYLDLNDIADDKAAAAVARFNLVAKDIASTLAAKAELDGAPVCLVFYRSGNMLFIDDVEKVMALDGVERHAPESWVLQHLHPVFVSEPNGHEIMGWTETIATDLSEIDISRLIEA